MPDAAGAQFLQMPWFFVIRTEVVSGGPSAPSARGVRTTLAAPAKDNVVRKWRRVCTIDF